MGRFEGRIRNEKILYIYIHIYTHTHTFFYFVCFLRQDFSVAFEASPGTSSVNKAGLELM